VSRLSSRPQPGRADQAANQKNNFNFTVECFSNNGAITPITTNQYWVAAALAHDLAQLASTSLLAKTNGGVVALPERTQFIESHVDYFDGAIVLEWGVFPDGSDGVTTRVTAERVFRQADEDVGYTEKQRQHMEELIQEIFPGINIRVSVVP
jgi:hypothetical protein